MIQSQKQSALLFHVTGQASHVTMGLPQEGHSGYGNHGNGPWPGAYIANYTYYNKCQGKYLQDQVPKAALQVVPIDWAPSTVRWALPRLH